MLFISAIAAVILLFCYCVPTTTYGKYLSEKELDDIFSRYTPSRRNSYNSDLIKLEPDVGIFIGKVFMAFGRYYIYGYGIIPYWSDYHIYIYDCYKNLPTD